MKLTITIDPAREALLKRALAVKDEEGVLDVAATEAAAIEYIKSSADQGIHSRIKHMPDADIAAAKTDEEIVIAHKAKKEVLGKTSSVSVAAVAIEK